MRNYAIDWIRSLSIFFIVGYWHLFNYTSVFPEYYNPISFALAMVCLGLFTLVSGYLIGFKKIELDNEQVGRFLRKRAERIYPPLVFALITFGIFGLSSPTTLSKSGLLLSVFFGPAPLTLWYVVMICIFYLLSPFLFIGSKNLADYLLVAIGIYLSLVILSQTLQDFDTRVLLYFPIFSLGVYLGQREKKIPIWLPAILLLPSFMISRNAIFYFSETSTALTPFILIAALLVFMATMELVSKRKAPIIILQLSYASYFMYLFHRPLFQFLIQIWFPAQEPFQIAYLVFICLPVVIFFSWLTQHLYANLLQWVRY